VPLSEEVPYYSRYIFLLTQFTVLCAKWCVLLANDAINRQGLIHHCQPSCGLIKQLTKRFVEARQGAIIRRGALLRSIHFCSLSSQFHVLNDVFCWPTVPPPKWGSHATATDRQGLIHHRWSSRGQHTGLIYLPLSKCATAPAVDDRGLPFPNQTFKYAIDVGALPNLGRAAIETMAPKTKILNMPVVVYSMMMQCVSLHMPMLIICLTDSHL